MYGSYLNVEKSQVDSFVPDSLSPLRLNLETQVLKGVLRMSIKLQHFLKKKQDYIFVQSL